jgi:hypothetical protein
LEYFGTSCWLIAGGASGPQAPNCETRWIGSLVEQGERAGARVFVKQLGARVKWDGAKSASGVFPRKPRLTEVPGGWLVHLDDKKGGDPAEWTKELRVRQMPIWARRAVA